MTKKKTTTIQETSQITEKAIRAALEAEVAQPRTPSDRSWLAHLSAHEVWRRSPWWIYDRFEWFDPATVGTGITAEQLAASIARCRFPHDPRRDLAWSQLRPGTRGYIEVVKRSGKAAVRMLQEGFLAGQHDPLGTWWCGLCFHRCEMMEVGAALGYPCAHVVYAVSPACAIGPEGWLRASRNCRPSISRWRKSNGMRPGPLWRRMRCLRCLTSSSASRPASRPSRMGICSWISSMHVPGESWSWGRGGLRRPIASPS